MPPILTNAELFSSKAVVLTLSSYPPRTETENRNGDCEKVPAESDVLTCSPAAKEGPGTDSLEHDAITKRANVNKLTFHVNTCSLYGATRKADPITPTYFTSHQQI